MNGSALKLRRVLEKHEDHRSRYRAVHLLHRRRWPYTDLLDPVFSLIESRALGAVTSTVTFAEILTRPFTDKNFALAEEVKFTVNSFAALTVVSIDEKLAEAAALIRARYTIRLPRSGSSYSWPKLPCF
jgi:hypothetical protein